MQKTIDYFDEKGVGNTDEVLLLARDRAKELGIKTVIVASSEGNTAVRAMDCLVGFKVVVVGLAIGSRAHKEAEPNSDAFTPSNRRIVEEKGGIILNTTHAFGGLSRAIRDEYSWSANPVALVTAGLRVFGNGMKVACEIAMMAADGGHVSTTEDVISIGGSGKGADTAIVLRPVNAHKFFDLKVKEIVCKPRF